MMSVPLQQLPNQSFSILLDSNQWDFLLKTVEDSTVVSLTLNGTDLLDSAKAPAGAFIIPSIYEESGNFFFVTQSFQLPYYTNFNVTQSLIYISATELATLRTPTPPPITAADFNPIAALPLRFQPVGYVES
jgi:hypothetical protein